MKLLGLVMACAMATAACGNSAMPDPNDPSTKIAVGDKPIASPAADLEQSQAPTVKVDTRTAAK